MRNIPYTVPLLPSFEDYASSIKTIWDNHHLTNNGPRLLSFEKALEEYLQVKNAACFVNGHLALECALAALELEGEVITTPFTFVSTIQALINRGLKPIFCDVDPVTFNINPSLIEKCITDKTSAILAVHVFGRPCDVTSLEEIAKTHSLKLIYDAAHAFGVNHLGKSLACYGDISMISFHATKVFNSIEGGALIFDNPELKSKLKNIANFGLVNGCAAFHGTNAKMNEFSAAMGALNLHIVEEEMRKRKSVVHLYNELLDGVDGVSLPTPDVHAQKHNYSYYPILIDEKKYGIGTYELYEKLLRAGVVSRRYFYPACNEMPLIKKLCPDMEGTSIASEVSRSVLTLPLHSMLTVEDIVYICNAIKKRGRE